MSEIWLNWLFLTGCLMKRFIGAGNSWSFIAVISEAWSKRRHPLKRIVLWARYLLPMDLFVLGGGVPMQLLPMPISSIISFGIFNSRGHLDGLIVRDNLLWSSSVLLTDISGLPLTKNDLHRAAWKGLYGILAYSFRLFKTFIWLGHRITTVSRPKLDSIIKLWLSLFLCECPTLLVPRKKLKGDCRAMFALQWFLFDQDGHSSVTHYFILPLLLLFSSLYARSLYLSQLGEDITHKARC